MARLIVMPSLGMYTAEGTLTNWLRPDGATVAAGEPIAEVTTEKATYEIEAPTAGVLHPVAAVGSDHAVQGLLGYVLEPGEAPPAETPGLRPAATSVTASAAISERASARGAAAVAPRPAGEIKATPVARRLASQHGLDLTSISGSGPGGRIVEADVLAAVERQQHAHSPSGVPGAVARRVRQRVPLVGIRRTIGERLRQSLATAVPVTLTREADAMALVEARSALAERLGRPVPFDALFVALFAAALREQPALNAVVEGNEIVELDEVHLGFAVATPAGLVVPVVHDADQRPLAEIVATVVNLGERARAGTLRPDDVGGGTATITNLGAHGVDAFTPIINPPQAVILGIGRIRPRPVWEADRWIARPAGILSLTFDHRVTDGAGAADLLAAIVRRLADADYLTALGSGRSGHVSAS